MQKVVHLYICILMSFLGFRTFARQTHLQQLKSRYPYGLIGDDYGILTEEDLAVNTCNVTKVAPFSGEKNMAYSYWQCFALKNVKIECSSLDSDPMVSAESGYLEFNATNKNGIQTYLARDAMTMRDCKRYIHYWKQKTRGERYVCISGSYGDFDSIKDGQKETGWVFDKFKTSKGCVANRSDCYLSHHPDKNCILPTGWAINK